MLSFAVLSAPPLLFFEKSLILTYISDDFFTILFEVFRTLWVLILTVGLSFYFATVKILDKRYERYDDNSIYSDGKKYEFLYGKYLKKIKKLKRSLATPVAAYWLYSIVVFLYFYLLNRNGSGADISSLFTLLFMCVSAAHFLTAKKAMEYTGVVKFICYINNENELEGLSIKFWNRQLVFIDDPYYFIYDNNKGKYMKFEIISRNTIDLMDKVYKMYIDEKVKHLKI